MISDAAMREFKAIWKATFGADVPDAVASETAMAILTLFKAIYRPLRPSDFENP